MMIDNFKIQIRMQRNISIMHDMFPSYLKFWSAGLLTVKSSTYLSVTHVDSCIKSSVKCKKCMAVCLNHI